ncbi:MAG: hypothetical protein MZV70_10445 [Desulfobacterales bacterium]|nr:hypothetical protein [Desulfobacterales bacterium]
MSAMSINFGVDEKGHVTEQLIRYMAARAEGGVGMMLVGGGGVHPTGVELPHLPRLVGGRLHPRLEADGGGGETARHPARHADHARRAAVLP